MNVDFYAKTTQAGTFWIMQINEYFGLTNPIIPITRPIDCIDTTKIVKKRACLLKL